MSDILETPCFTFFWTSSDLITAQFKAFKTDKNRTVSDSLLQSWHSATSEERERSMPRQALCCSTRRDKCLYSSLLEVYWPPKVTNSRHVSTSSFVVNTPPICFSKEAGGSVHTRLFPDSHE